MDVLNSSLTPVRFSSQSPVKQQANFTALKSQLDKLVQDLQSNYAKWQLAQQRGTTLCHAIEAKKTHCLEQATEDSSGYPEDMQVPCEKLAIISSIFVDIVRNTHEIARQLRALVKSAGPLSDAICYRTWKLQQFTDFTKELLERYGKESAVKQRVMQNIAHCTTRSQLVIYTTTWEFPDHIDAYVELLFRLLAEEVQSN